MAKIEGCFEVGDEGVNKWSQLVQRVITWLSLRNVLGAVIEMEKAQEEGEPITTHDGAEGESCKGPRCNPAILNGWETSQPHYDNQSKEPL